VFTTRTRLKLEQTVVLNKLTLQRATSQWYPIRDWIESKIVSLTYLFIFHFFVLYFRCNLKLKVKSGYRFISSLVKAKMFFLLTARRRVNSFLVFFVLFWVCSSGNLPDQSAWCLKNSSSKIVLDFFSIQS
jgi:hypothetical protein